MKKKTRRRGKRRKRKKRERLEKKKEKEELAKKKAEEKLKRASQPPRQSKRSGKKLAASRSSNQVESTLSALSGPSHNSTTATLEVGTSLSIVTTHDTVMHTTELNSASSTATVAPAGLNDQDYECCECFVTFEEDIILGKSGLSVDVEGGFMLTVSMKLLWMKVESPGCAHIVSFNLIF